MNTSNHSSRITPRPVWFRMLVGKSPLTTLVRCAVVAALLLVTAKFVLLPVRVAGISMEPTFANNQFNLINRIAYLTGEPERGDIVGIRIAGNRALYMKRIIGLPGEIISIQGGQVHVDGSPLKETYVKKRANWNVAPVTLQPGEYYVIGDNREMAQDDHLFGRVERSRIIGRVAL